MSSDLSLPVDVPWTLLSVSPDMMDTSFCDKTFPFEWRSSLAIFGYELPVDDIPEGLCDVRITMLKVTVSITGYEPSTDETKKGYTDFPDVPIEDLSKIIGQYWGCWGVLLNVAVFPFPIDPEAPLDQYPHIVELEPKTRDLYQASTDTAEMLTASKSGVNVGKSQSNTQTQETGLGLHSDYDSGQTPYGDFKGGWTATHQWGSTDTDASTVQTDASRESRETKGTTTNISQLYNLLSGYHLGTNRATFLMLPRPHTLQATDHRTFIQGLRMIEGIQEFFLIVSRPSSAPGLAVEARLETGHFPENIQISVPPPVYDTGSETFLVTADATGGNINSNTTQIESDPSSTHNLQSGWVVDRQNPGSDPAHQGIMVVSDDSWGARDRQGNFNVSPQPHGQYQATADATVQASGRIWSNGGWGAGAHYNVTFKVFTRSEQPVSNPDGGGGTVTTPFLITARSLCTAFRPNDQCIKSLQVEQVLPRYPVSVVDEPMISLSADYLTPEKLAVTRQPAIKQLMRKLQSAMSNSHRSPTRRPIGQTGFLESDYFKNQIAPFLSNEALASHVGGVEGLPAAVAHGLGNTTTVGEALKLDLSSFARKTGLSIPDAAEARTTLLRGAYRKPEQGKGNA